ncbi:hypothetical protein [Hyphomonas chukchiensis]|uniref:Uncharacterized protein n=1 Tax=Hyphomonas chukchiensis TaxID=1280947 RepID=A0A062UQS6_9PROT|nr:hypothetical protein [Hyphomonas chukchiensis]KCZ59447.1 hypothetical protein HY30_14360 [Hyphomonas chukchiensis]
MSDFPSTDEVPELRRGILAARNNYRIAQVALNRYVSSEDRDLESLALYGGAFFVFARAAIEALRSSDSRDDPSLTPINREYFETHIKNSDVFRVVKTERNLIAHGDDSWAIHPFKPMGLILRAIEENKGDWYEAVFNDGWLFDPFKGQPIDEVMAECIRQIGQWLDEIDIAHGQAWKPSELPS